MAPSPFRDPIGWPLLPLPVNGALRYPMLEQSVRDTIRDLAGNGGAALVISTDLDELLELCARILVLSRGRVVGEVENGPKAGERVGELMVGAGDVVAA